MPPLREAPANPEVEALFTGKPTTTPLRPGEVPPAVSGWSFPTQPGAPKAGAPQLAQNTTNWAPTSGPGYPTGTYTEPPAGSGYSSGIRNPVPGGTGNFGVANANLGGPAGPTPEQLAYAQALRAQMLMPSPSFQPQGDTEPAGPPANPAALAAAVGGNSGLAQMIANAANLNRPALPQQTASLGQAGVVGGGIPLSGGMAITRPVM